MVVLVLAVLVSDIPEEEGDGGGSACCRLSRENNTVGGFFGIKPGENKTTSTEYTLSKLRQTLRLELNIYLPNL